MDPLKSKLSSNNLPPDWSSKWEICDFRPDLLICRLIPYRDYAKSIKPSTRKPLPIYESSQENNGFDEPTIPTTKSAVVKFTNGIAVTSTTSTTIPSTETTHSNETTSTRPIRQSEKTDEEKLTPQNITVSSSTILIPESPIQTTEEPEGDVGSHHIKKQLTEDPTMISSTLSPSKEIS
uniref:Uncharacterized protein n=1 Tax=Panagrolaimus sp. JU765 TaxID=591449 RepID=A0AC34Q678_9BILA